MYSHGTELVDLWRRTVHENKIGNAYLLAGFEPHSPHLEMRGEPSTLEIFMHIPPLRNALQSDGRRELFPDARGWLSCYF
jgi:hypothetical protein